MIENMVNGFLRGMLGRVGTLFKYIYIYMQVKSFFDKSCGFAKRKPVVHMKTEGLCARS